ncbi:MAG TPA: hypothetical protein VMH28_05215 [Candidatus Acidoferrales bacterium]|nr:hypothetical protein [Candidatus Acidoferrales bacterium]
MPRPPGGKVLLRLLNLLGAAGYDSAARAAIGLAIVSEQQADFVARVNEFTTLPGAALDGGAQQTVDEQGAIAEEIAAEYLTAARLGGPPTPTGPQWRSLGAAAIPNGQTYGSSRVNVSGRVAAVAVDPSNANHVLCGAANGGVWESQDGGSSWAPRTDYAATTAVGAIAFDLGNPNTVYCGTGEGNWWWFVGTGVLRSTDGGTTWSPLATAPFVGQGFYDLVVDPATGMHLLAGTTGGLYVSANGGISWTQQRAAPTYSISMAPGGGANAEILAACGDGVWRSTDGGTTWNAVALPGAQGNYQRLAVAIAPTDATIAYVWAAGAPYNFGGGTNPTPYLWQRAGGTWTALAVPPGVATGQAWYDWFLAVSPDSAGQVYCGAISVHRGTHTGTAWTWLDIATKSSGDSIHPDSHAIAFQPGNANVIYVGDDGGLFKSPNRGVNWQSCNNGLVITELEYVAQNFGSSRWVIAGTQDNGTDRWTGSPIWDHVADGDGGDCAVNRLTPTTVFHTFYDMSPQISNSSGDWNTWSNITPPVPQGELSPFYPPFACSSTSGNTIAIAGNALYVSQNSGTNWARLVYPNGGSGSAVLVPDANTVLVGLGDGRILRTTFSGSTWSALSALTTPRAGASVSDIVVDANSSSRIWVTYSTVGGGRVYLSTNGGASWTDRTGALPNLSMNAIQLDPQDSNRAWIGASLGVYQTTDGGNTWNSFSASLPNAWIGDLRFHPWARVLRAATRSRGLWEIPVDGWMTQPVCGVQWTGTLNANQTERWFTFNWPATWHVVWTVMPTTTGSAPQLSWQVQVQRASAEFVTYWITVTNLTAAALTFQGRYCILSQY